MFVDTFNRLKNWLNPPAPVILKMEPAGTRKHSVHWIQVSSSREACPVFPEDRCAYQPADLRYLPCQRLANHSGPCAHDFRLGIFNPDELAFVEEIDREEDVLGFFPGDQ